MSTHMTLKIEGMTCGSCSKSVTARLNKFDFVENVNVDWESGKGELDVKGSPDQYKDEIVNAVNQLGYKVVDVKIE
ncbi:MAG: heavy-metal-associated domain-containing protein [Methanobacteriota archaeon]|nr:MAG: heavy-metal-associated domain-containing protein [Euryarchaeota archaeon]